MSKTPEVPETSEQYAEQQEAIRQELIDQDKALHDESGDPSPFPGDAADLDKKSKKK